MRDFKVDPIVLAQELKRILALVLHHYGVVKFPADKSLGVVDNITRVQQPLELSSLAHQPLHGREGHRGGRDPAALVVGNHLSGTILKDSYTTEGGPEVDTNGKILA